MLRAPRGGAESASKRAVFLHPQASEVQLSPCFFFGCGVEGRIGPLLVFDGPTGSPPRLGPCLH